MRQLATMRRDQIVYTLALTLPGDFETITPTEVHEAFKSLSDRFTASKLFPDVSYFWKREFQKRGALHYHLVIYGLEDEPKRDLIHLWLATQWNSLVCVGLTDKERENHFKCQIHPNNLEKVRKNIAKYFAKYVSKDPGAGQVEVPGRWWGKVNHKALPVSVCSRLSMPERAAIIAHRIARKVKQKRSDEAKHLAISMKLGFMRSNGQPIFSQFEILRMKQGHDPSPLASAAIQWLARNIGERWGKAPSHKCTRFAKIHLISAISPQTALQIMKHVGERFKDWKEMNPF
jgi:hypothetical protein